MTDTKTKELLEKIKKTIHELDVHLVSEQINTELESEAFLIDYNHILNSTSDHLSMVMYLFPSEVLLEKFTVPQREEFIQMIMGFRETLRSIHGRLDALEDEVVRLSF